MQIDYCLILAAGFGTRMGAIGRELPKVLWPVFEKTLLELQVAYAKSLGINKIFINLHYMGEATFNYCKNNPAFDDVIFLWENPVILDIGGAIHNLALRQEINYKGRLLVLNGDQFFYLEKEKFFEAADPFEKFSVVLFSYRVNSNQGYNGLSIDSDRFLKGIIKNQELIKNSEIETYTGISIIDLSKLRVSIGPSNFFETVCLYKQIEIPVISLENVNYWDFGTIKRYWDTMFLILNKFQSNSNDAFINFLISQNAFLPSKVNLKVLSSYHAEESQVINLNPSKISSAKGPVIFIKGAGDGLNTKASIYFGNIKEEI